MTNDNLKASGTAAAKMACLLAVSDSYRVTAERIIDTAADEYAAQTEQLCRIIADVADLFAGRWPSHEACQVKYHNFGHTLDVTLSTLRMIIGWNRSNPLEPIPGSLLLAAMTAALFHDAGYIKDKGDLQGQGGKFTFIHVDRGRDIAAAYLKNQGWQLPDSDLVGKIISITDYQKNPGNMTKIFPDPAELTMARIVASSDLVAQMADTAYMLRISDLFDEFSEGYEFEGPAVLLEKGARVYSSAEEIMEGTIRFYEQFVLPLMEKFGRMDRFLAAFFNDGRNPYLENIAANLSNYSFGSDSQWRRLGQILQDLGLLAPEGLERALSRQHATEASFGQEPSTLVLRKLFRWKELPISGASLGEILIEMDAVRPDALGKALLAQVLPESLTRSMSREELLAMLECALLLPNVARGRWLLDQVLHNIAACLNCRNCRLLLADRYEEGVLRPFSSSPPSSTDPGQKIYIDKGVDGWVFSNARPAFLNLSASAAPTDENQPGSGEDAGRLLAVPLYGGGSPIGVLAVENRPARPFTEHDTHLLVVFANMLSSTLTDLASRQAA